VDEVASPVAQHVRLLASLRQTRDRRNETLRAVADALDWSEPKLSRVESGLVGLSITDLRALLDHYQVGESEQARLVDLARCSRKRGWYDEYRPYYPPEFIRFVGLEASAFRVRQFQLLLVPGLLQTHEYTRAVATGTDPDDEKINREIELRTRRQQRLDTGATTYHFVLDESVIHRRVGTEAVHARQLKHLLRMADNPAVSIQVLPFERGLVPGMASSFEVFDLSATEPDVGVLVERPERDTLIISPEAKIRSFASIFEHLAAVALSPSDSKTMIKELLERVED
jgi:transcriptional regulator with XRE-family HTH domain